MVDEKKSYFVDKPILIEIVSAQNLRRPGVVSPPSFDVDIEPVNAFCVLEGIVCGRDGNEVRLHETKVIKNTINPIWTIQSNSLYLLQKFDNSAGSEAFEAITFKILHQPDSLLQKSFSCGQVTVPLDVIKEGKGTRLEFPLICKNTNRNKEDDDGMEKSDVDEDIMTNQSTVALRFRTATLEDRMFMSNFSYQKTKKKKVTDGGPSDFTFQQEQPMLHFFESGVRKGKGNEPDKFRVKPYPDPNNPVETKWFTKNIINEQSLEPSKKWVQAGQGDLGIIYLEVISCDDLPNLDSGRAGDVTDPFVGIIFEDSLVRTDVIHNELSPRWMPWTQRAFAFPIKHSSSLLFLGVFDYDSAPLQNHSPVGRVIIDMANYKNKTVYLLSFKMHSDPDCKDERGIINIRLRVEWQDERKALLKSFSTPRHFFLNVNNRKAFRVVRYLCRGEVNMEKSSIDSVKLYGAEIVSYFDVFLIIIDILIGMLLWRGHIHFSMERPEWIKRNGTNNEETDKLLLVKGKLPSSDKYIRFSLWFPIQSMIVFQTVITAIENPHLIPAFLCFGAGWTLFAIAFYKKMHPSPWKRCRSLRHFIFILFVGYHVHLPVYVDPYDGDETAQELKRREDLKTERIRVFLAALKAAVLKFKREYTQTDSLALIEVTEDKGWGLWDVIGNHLYFVHLGMMYTCKYLRMVRNIISWQAPNYSFVLMTFCFALGTFFLLVPWVNIMVWTLRIFAWTILGPWMKLVDLYLVQPHQNLPKDEEGEKSKEQDPSLDSVFQSPRLQQLAKMVKIAIEDSTKLTHMREYRFGNLTEAVPLMDSTRFPSVPLPQSSARPYHKDFEKQHKGYECLPKTQLELKHVPGQALYGNMIHTYYKKNGDACSEDSDSEDPPKLFL